MKILVVFVIALFPCWLLNIKGKWLYCCSKTMGPSQNQQRVLTPAVLFQFHRHLLSLSVQKISGKFMSHALKATLFNPPPAPQKKPKTKQQNKTVANSAKLLNRNFRDLILVHCNQYSGFHWKEQAVYQVPSDCRQGGWKTTHWCQTVTLSCDSASPHVPMICTFSHCFSFSAAWFQELLGPAVTPLQHIGSERQRWAARWMESSRTLWPARGYPTHSAREENSSISQFKTHVLTDCYRATDPLEVPST